MTHILHRQIGHAYPVAVGGQGVVLRDADGREYIDASGGAATDLQVKNALASSVSLAEPGQPAMVA